VKLSTLKLDAERDREFEQRMREHHNCQVGGMLFHECQMCTYKRLVAIDPGGTNEIRITPLPEGVECDLCVEVQTRTPEVYQWVVLMVSSLARDTRESLNPGDER
jgi:hypothetical protein